MGIQTHKPLNVTIGQHVTYSQRIPVMLRMDSYDTLPEQRLWQARILQYLQDSLARNPRRYAKQIQREAKEFFNPDNPDFIATCDFAGWPPHVALAMFTSVQQTGTVPRLVKCISTDCHDEGGMW